MLTQNNYDYCDNVGPTPPLTVEVSVDNVGATTLVVDVTLSAINASGARLLLSILRGYYETSAVQEISTLMNREINKGKMRPLILQ